MAELAKTLFEESDKNRDRLIVVDSVFDLIEDEYKEYFKIVVRHRGRFIADVEHSLARFRERTTYSDDVYISLLKKGIDYLFKNGLENVEDNYVFISKSKGFGIHVHWRHDVKNKRNIQCQGFSATTFSHNEMKGFKPNTSPVLLESMYTRILFNEDVDRELDLCNMQVFTEDNRLYATAEFVEL